MPAKGDGITKRKDGRYMARYTIQTPEGPKRKLIYGRKYKEVEKKLAEARGDAARGIVYHDENLTVGKYLDRWLSDAVKGTVRGSTFSRDKYLVTNHISPALGGLRLKNLNALRLQGLYRECLDSGLKASTVQKIHHVLYKALAQAMKWDLIPRNPADAVKAPTPQPKEMRPLSAQEARRFLEAARGDRLEALYALAIHTGMRRGELLALRWGDVSLEETEPGVVRVYRTLTRTEDGKGITLGDPKTKRAAAPCA
jgi:integrase